MQPEDNFYVPAGFQMAGDGTPGNNKAQNKQAKDAIREAERKTGQTMSPDDRDRFHKDVHGQDFGWQDLVDAAIDILTE